MTVACLGLGNMGAVLAERLLAAGHDVCGFDLSRDARDRLEGAGGRVATSAPAAAADAEAVVLCLPNAGIVEAVVAEVLDTSDAVPPLWIDCTSSLPVVTRRVGARLGERDGALVDAPVTGGVAGAREGALTAMVGGEPADCERARPFLECFAARVLPAGPLGAGHAVKAINNALSSASLVATAELTAAAGRPLQETVERINDSLARSQNSEVKFVRDIVPGRYASGFAVGLMGKDVATACALSDAVPLPLMSLLRALWRVVETELGAGADFTRVYELVERWSPEPAGREDLAVPDALAGVLALAAREALSLSGALGLDREAALTIVNAGSGRSELTRLAECPSPVGLTVGTALGALDTVLSAPEVAAPFSRLAEEGLRDLDPDADLAALVTP
jgi:3-hydroxyisobutyrate dehydrogenase